MTGLFIKLDAYAEDHGFDAIEAVTDPIDKSLARRFQRALERTRSISGFEQKVHGWDPSSKKAVEGTFGIRVPQAPIQLDVTKVRDLVVGSKNDPLIFLADVVTNDLYRHLGRLGHEVPLNAPSSIAGWKLAQNVYGVRDDAIEDNL